MIDRNFLQVRFAQRNENAFPLVLTLGLFCLGLHAEEVEPDVPTIHLFSEGKDNEEGLQVSLKQKNYPGIKTEKIEFHVLIVNRMLEEVFVEVTHLGEASVVIEGDAGYVSTGGGGIFFPDNVPLLKRLHATQLSNDGERFTCGCATTSVKQSAELDLDLSRWVGATGTLSFRVSGFYRASGKAFSETIDLKFSITEPPSTVPKEEE